MRRFVPVVAVTLLGGCAAVPPAIGLASYALDGVSLLTSGRTVSDHALSAAANQDCKLFRMMQNLEVCTDWGTEPQIAKARPQRIGNDRDDPWEPDDVGVYQVALGNGPSIVDREEAAMALPADLADVAQALPGVAKTEPLPPVATALIAPSRPPIAPRPAAQPQPAKLVMTALVPSAPVAAPAAAPALKAEPVIAAVVRPVEAQPRRDAFESRYVMVLGSFKGPETAGRMAKLYPGSKVATAAVQGETVYRVVIDPDKGAKVSKKLGEKPWLVPTSTMQVAELATTLR